MGCAGVRRHIGGCRTWRVAWAICPSRRHNHARPWVVPGMAPAARVVEVVGYDHTSGDAWLDGAHGQSALHDATTMRGLGLCRGWHLQRGPRAAPHKMQDVACRMGNLPITTPQPRGALGCAGDASLNMGHGRRIARNIRICVTWRVGWAICPSRNHNHARPWVVPGLDATSVDAWHRW